MSDTKTVEELGGTSQFVSKRLKFSVLDKIRRGDLDGVVDKEGNFIDDIFTKTEEGNRKKISYFRFCKLARVDTAKLDHFMRKTDYYYLMRITNKLDKHNTINFDHLADLNIKSVRDAVGRMKKAGLVDKLRLFHTAKWYVNPFYCTAGRTVDIRLFKHFQGKIEYAIYV